MTAFGVTGVVGQVVAIPFLSNKMRWSDTTILIVTTSTAVANQERVLDEMAKRDIKFYKVCFCLLRKRRGALNVMGTWNWRVA